MHIYVCIYTHIYIYEIHTYTLCNVCMYTQKEPIQKLKKKYYQWFSRKWVTDFFLFSFLDFSVFLYVNMYFFYNKNFSNISLSIFFSLILSATVYEPNRAQFTLLSFFSVLLSWNRHKTHWWVGNCQGNQDSGATGIGRSLEGRYS